MGRLVYQHIRECYECGETPVNGSKMWEMPDGFICEECVEAQDNEQDRECHYCGEESCDCDML